MPVRRALFLCALLLGASPASSAPPGAEDADRPGGVDRFLKGAAKIFTSDDKRFGEVHFPVVSANPNSGITYGVLPVWLVSNSRREIRQIFAPMFTYNKTYGVAFSGTYYWYPSSRAKLRALLEKSQTSNQRAGVQYEDHGLFEGRSSLILEGNVESDGGAKFYGTGPRSRKGDEASERLIEDLLRAEWGLRASGPYSASLGWKVRRTDVRAGPFSAARPLDPALQTRTSYSLPRVGVSRDTRDLPFTPTSGSLTELYAERSARAWGSDADYGHYGGQWRFYTRTSEEVVTVLHAQTEWSGGGAVPFTALSALGGSRSLRGFAEGRFQDRGSIFVNVEERWLIHALNVVRSRVEFQVAPFLETGTVFPSLERARRRDLETVVGVAMRAVVKPTVVGKVEVGAGREGPAIFMGIDYPF
jgi:hypothetical protein